MRDGFFVFDTHAHIQLTEHWVAGRDARHTTDALLGAMRTYGIDAAAVIAHAWAGWRLADYQREHDRIAEAIANHPRSLIGVCWSDPLLGRDAVSELRRCVNDLGYRGVKLHPVYQRFPFDGREARLLVEEAALLQIPVVAHLDLRIPGCEPWRMFELARGYPTVTFVMAHMGRDAQALSDGSIARGAADVPNVLLEGSSTTTDSYGTFGLPAAILGSRRVLFASDSGALHHPAINLLKMDLLDMPREGKADVLGLNALRVFQMDRSDFDPTPNRERGVFATPSGMRRYSFPAEVFSG